MYNRQFWNSKLGQAAMASILAMTAMVALTSQFQSAPDSFITLTGDSAMVELA